jgi:putative ABC transport system permease protein
MMTNIRLAFRNMFGSPAYAATSLGTIALTIALASFSCAALGAMLGLLMSWWTTRLVSGFLYEVDAHAAGIWAIAACALVLIAAAAAWIPARRASAVDPVKVLRAD